MLPAYVRRVEDPGFGSVVSLGGLSCRRTLLKTADGEQHLLLRAPDQVVQIRCVGEDLAFDPFALELVVDAFPDIESRQKLIRRLADLYRGRRKSDVPWTAQALFHRDSLIALDCKAARLSDRETAIFLFGSEPVAAEWPSRDGPLRARTRRLIRAGRRLVAGGYRTLLA